MVEKTAFSLFILLIWQNALQIRFSWIQYLDEFLTVAFLIIYTVKVLRERKIQLGAILIFADLLLILFIGLAGNRLNSSQVLKAVMQDIFLCFKFALMYVTASNIFSTLNKDKLRLWAVKAVEVFTVLLSMIATADIIFHLFPTPDYRYGFYSRMLFFSHPTYYSACLIQLCIVYIISVRELKRRNLLFLGILSVLTLTTLRTKAIAAIAVMWLVIFFVKRRIKIKGYFLLLAGIISFFLAGNQIYFYFFENNQYARSILLTKGIEIAKAYFPIGTGFGTYATYASGVYYSEIYSRFHIDQIYGLTKDNPLFFSDCFWPAVLGQFGFAGTLLYVVLIFLIFSYCMRRAQGLKQRSIVYFSAAYFLILSIAESSFFNPIAVSMFYILSLFI